MMYTIRWAVIFVNHENHVFRSPTINVLIYVSLCYQTRVHTHTHTHILYCTHSYIILPIAIQTFRWYSRCRNLKMFFFLITRSCHVKLYTAGTGSQNNMLTENASFLCKLIYNISLQLQQRKQTKCLQFCFSKTRGNVVGGGDDDGREISFWLIYKKKD